MSFTDEVVVVTGAGSGIGRAMAQEFHREGAAVVALDVDLEAARKTAADLDERASAHHVDLRDRGRIVEVVGEIVDRYGRIDVLCNNAGLLDGYANALDTDDSLWDRIISVNLTAPFLMSRAVLPTMLAQGKGSIVNTASIAGWVAGGGGTAYTASKHGVIGLTKQLAYDFGARGVRVNAICPGAISTGMTADLVDDPHVTEMIGKTLAGRWAEPAEIAHLAVFLASDKAAFAHGSVMVLDGGWTVA